jgi:hypothetical protein
LFWLFFLFYYASRHVCDDPVLQKRGIRGDARIFQMLENL